MAVAAAEPLGAELGRRRCHREAAQGTREPYATAGGTSCLPARSARSTVACALAAAVRHVRGMATALWARKAHTGSTSAVWRPLHSAGASALVNRTTRRAWCRAARGARWRDATAG